MKINQSRHTDISMELKGKDANTVLNVTKGVRRIRQRYKSDCGVACVAMVASVTYRQAFKAFGFGKDRKTFYTSISNLEDALNNLGFQVHRRKFQKWEVISGSAIIPVNHRCNRQHFHWVVFDGQAVLDPNPNRPSRQKTFKRYRASGWYLQAVVQN